MGGGWQAHGLDVFAEGEGLCQLQQGCIVVSALRVVGRVPEDAQHLGLCPVALTITQPDAAHLRHPGAGILEPVMGQIQSPLAPPPSRRPQGKQAMLYGDCLSVVKAVFHL